jgi:DedD protein
MPENTKKFLWIGAAISVFVLLIVAAVFFIFSPSPSGDKSPFNAKEEVDPKTSIVSDYLANAPATTTETPANSEPKGGDIIIVYGDDRNTQTSVAPLDQAPRSSSTTIVIAPQETKAPIPAAPVVSAPPASAPASTPTTTVRVVAAPPAPKPKAAVVPPVVKAPAAASSNSEYWIQAGSFKVKSSADSLTGTFKNKNLSASTVVKDIDGSTYYQVKVGPYPSREEAAKWVGTVKAVPGASTGSYVTR